MIVRASEYTLLCIIEEDIQDMASDERALELLVSQGLSLTVLALDQSVKHYEDGREVDCIKVPTVKIPTMKRAQSND